MKPQSEKKSSDTRKENDQRLWEESPITLIFHTDFF